VTSPSRLSNSLIRSTAAWFSSATAQRIYGNDLRRKHGRCRGPEGNRGRVGVYGAVYGMVRFVGGSGGWSGANTRTRVMGSAVSSRRQMWQRYTSPGRGLSW
jgi:hypothetical protein